MRDAQLIDAVDDPFAIFWAVNRATIRSQNLKLNSFVSFLEECPLCTSGCRNAACRKSEIGWT